MSWIRLRLGRGTLKIKRRAQMRSFETDGTVPTLNVGFFIIAWWSDAAQRRYDSGHVATRLANVPDAAGFAPPAAEKPRADERGLHIPPPVIERTGEKAGADRPPF